MTLHIQLQSETEKFLKQYTLTSEVNRKYKVFTASTLKT